MHLPHPKKVTMYDNFGIWMKFVGDHSYVI